MIGDKNTLFANRIDKEKLMVILLGAVCFVIHLHLPEISHLNGPFLYHDEMGYWTNAASMAGYNWSPVIIKNGTPWYAYGYSLTLLPLFWLFDDMTTIYKAAIALNALWATLSFFVCYKISLRIGKKMNQYWLILFSFIISVYSSSLLQSSIAVSETFLTCAVWVLFLSFVRYEENPTPIHGTWLGCAVYFVYLIHHRTIGILIAFCMTILIMIVMKKIKVRDLIFIAIPIILLAIVNMILMEYLSAQIWGNTEKSNEDYLNQINNLKYAFGTPNGFLQFVKSVVGKVWYIGTSSFMLCIWGILRVVRRIRLRFFPQSELIYSLIFFLLSYLGMIAISAVFTISAARVDFVFYGRYSECVAGIFLLLGFVELLELSTIPTAKKLAVLACSFIGYSICVIIVAPFVNSVLQINHDIGSISYTSAGINFVHVLGDLSIKNSSIMAIVVGFILFAFFSLDKTKLLQMYRIIACLFVVCMFFCAGLYSIKAYTCAHQKSNNSKDFYELVEWVEGNVAGEKIFVGSNSMYDYFDFQTRMIHNSVYADEPESIKNSTEYDIIILKSSDLIKIPKTNYRLCIVNNSYAMAVSDALMNKKNIEIQELNSDTLLVYDLGELEFFPFSGFSGNEKTFRWTNESPAELEVFTLEEGYDYRCTIVFGPGAPENSQDSTGRIVINGYEEKAIEFEVESSGQAEFTFDIDQSLLTGETDTFQIYSPLWSPADHGSSDTRTLGVSIDKIIFEKQE